MAPYRAVGEIKQRLEIHTI